MCGLTRGFYSIWQINPAAASTLNPLSVPLFVFFVMEICFRLFVIIKSQSLKAVSDLAGSDLRIHILLAVCYLLYSTGFIFFRWKFTL